RPAPPHLSPLSLHDALPIFNRQLRGLIATATVTLFAVFVLTVFLMPLGYMTTGALKDDAQLAAQNAPQWPASLKMYNYEGKDYPDRKSTRLNSSHVSNSYAV